MTARELTPTEIALRVIVAQNLPGVEPELASAYAEHIHIDTPFGRLGLSDVSAIHVGLAVERAFNCELSDDDLEQAKTIRALAVLVDRQAAAEVA